MRGGTPGTPLPLGWRYGVMGMATGHHAGRQACLLSCLCLSKSCGMTTMSLSCFNGLAKLLCLLTIG